MNNPFINKILNDEDEFIELIKSKIGLRFEGFSSNSIYPYNSLNFKASITRKNSNLKGTPYLFTEGKNLIHFTSLKALFSIIN